MDFRLIYKGPLSAEGSSGGKSTEKQRLRKHFHSQLRELWNQHPDLRSQAQSFFYKSDQGEAGTKIIQVEASLTTASNVKTWVEHIADDHQKCGGRFVPLISKAGGFTCALDILFLRRDNPGHLIAHGGDIDNRIKVLLDGLRMPDTEGELGGLSLEDDENPFFCLLEDDRLITALSVTTDRLLMPVEMDEHVKHVYLVIHVTVQNPSALFAGGRLV